MKVKCVGYKQNDETNYYDSEVVTEQKQEREFIVIRRDGQKVIAEHHIGKQIVKSASSHCNPEDEFVFEKGADIAYMRLRDKVGQNTLYEGKVVCIDNTGGGYTVGKIYKFEDGHIEQDDGFIIGRGKGFHSFDEWNKWSSAEWLEVIE